MKVRVEWVEWSLESWYGLRMSKMTGGEAFPDVTIERSRLRLFYCYYEPLVAQDKDTEITLSFD